MPLPERIHIVGASGSGTTSQAAAIAAKHGHRHLEGDRPVADQLIRIEAAVG